MILLVKRNIIGASVFCTITSMFFITQGVASTLLNSVEANIRSIEDVIAWSNKNLHYQNDDLWDEAPLLEEIVKKGHGDCKMLAGVVSELLNYIGVQNWIITIKRKKMYHMFNVYSDSSGTMRVVENARLLPQEFNDIDQILRYFKVDRFVARHPAYEDFRNWYNIKVYRHEGTSKNLNNVIPAKAGIQ